MLNTTTAVASQGDAISKEHYAATVALEKAFKAGKISYRSYNKGMEFIKREANHLRYLVKTFPLITEQSLRSVLAAQHIEGVQLVTVQAHG